MKKKVVSLLLVTTMVASLAAGWRFIFIRRWHRKDR